MVSWKKFLFTHGLVVFSPIFALAQYGGEIPHSMEVHPDTSHMTNRTAVVFDKFLNTYHWNGSASLSQSFGTVSLQLREHYFSTLTHADRNFIKDEQSFDLSLKHRWSGSLRGAAAVTSFILSDNRGIGINNASSHAAYGGIEYQPLEHLFFEPLIGLRLDNQVEQKDRGASYLLKFMLDTVNLDGYRTSFGGRFQLDQLSPRQLETHTAGISVDKIFFEQTRNLLRMFFNRNQRDFYVPADSIIIHQYNTRYNIERRSENAFSLSNALDYNFGSRLLLSSEGNILTRVISRTMRYQTITNGRTNTFNTSISEFRIDGNAQARYVWSGITSTAVQFFYQERDEQHTVEADDRIALVVADSASRAEGRKNNHSRRTSLGVDLRFAFSPSDSLAFTGSSTLLRYDTPSLENDDDRDELWHSLGISLLHRFNRHLSVDFIADVNLTHLVYLLSSRSADNTWNRILRLSPRLEYRPSQSFVTLNMFEVLANYTVYDFEYPSLLTRSFVFRQFAFVDSTGIDLTQRLGIEVFTNLRFYERGQLRWEEFTERPMNYFEDKTFIVTARFHVNEGLLFSCGIRYFSQTRFQFHGNDRILDNFLRSVGPISNISWHVTDRTDLLVKGWFEHQSQTNQPDRSFANMTMTFTFHL